MDTQKERDTIAADLFAELTIEQQCEAIIEADPFEDHVLPSIVSAYVGDKDDLAQLGAAVLACVDDYLKDEIEQEINTLSSGEHDAKAASDKINRDNAQQINANRGVLDPTI